MEVVDQSTDFGNGLVLIPECDGIQVKVRARPTDDFWTLEGVITRSELQEFLDRAYGSQERRLEP